MHHTLAYIACDRWSMHDMESLILKPAQVTLVRTISASAPRTNDLERAKHMPLGSSELERLRSAGLASVHKHAFSARHWQVLCEAEVRMHLFAAVYH